MMQGGVCVNLKSNIATPPKSEQSSEKNIKMLNFMFSLLYFSLLKNLISQNKGDIFILSSGINIQLFQILL